MKKGILLRLLLVLLCHVSITTAKSCPAKFNSEVEITSHPSTINTIYLPFELIGKLMVVEARIDNITGKFIIDTGAERLLLNEHYFSHLRGGKVESTGNTGVVSNAYVKTISALHLYQLEIINIQAHILDLSHIEKSKKASIIGILGYDVFRDFEIFIDSPNKRIVLNRISRKGMACQPFMPTELPEDSLEFDLIKHMVVMKGTVNDVNLRFILDSGAELNLIDRRVGKKVLERFTIISRVKMIGANQNKMEVIAGTLNNVTCGNQHCNDMRTLLTSLDGMNDMLGTSVQGVLGYEFLHNRRVLINYGKEKIYFYSVNNKVVAQLP